MHLLITGGAGFIGSNYVRRIIDGTLGGISKVTVLDKLTYAGNLTNFVDLPKDAFEFVQGDICDRDLVNKLVANSDAIVNFAAESHVDRSILSAQAFVKTNVMGTQVLLDSVKNGKRFVQISTDEVYGSINKGFWSEDQPLLPNSPYSASKAAADLLTRSYFRTFAANVSITRCSNNYGPYQFPEKIIPLFITNLIDDQEVPLYGEGSNVRDWLHVDDHCKAVHTVLLSGKAGEIYNIGGGAELSNRELSIQIVKALGKDLSYIKKVPDRLGHDFRYSVSIEKIKKELLYVPQIKFVDGLKDTIKWYQENESWWRPLKQRLAGTV
jgi:dTDP-glucose 4,6-dehydratase